eukprot:Hpha_TRINITY_DN15837_c2_g1::TRINITY_DN15837_c2_g1_i5::g.190322::m.190322
MKQVPSQLRRRGGRPEPEDLEDDGRLAVDVGDQKKKRRRRKKRWVGPTLLILGIFMLVGGVLFGGRLYRMLRSSAARGYVPGWETSEDVREKSAVLEHDDLLSHLNTRCRLPYYPDSVRASPRRNEFVRRFWSENRRATVLHELGTGLWTQGALVGSVDTLNTAAKTAGGWILHFAHTNRTELEHHIPLDAVLKPDDPLEAPTAEIGVPPTPGELPGYWIPPHKDEEWKVEVIPALSGHSPKRADEPFYMVVLAGRIRFIAYTQGYAFTIHDDHVWGWHENRYDKVRLSGNHGEMCFVETDQAVVLPANWGYSFLALENTVLLRIPVSRDKATWVE